MKTGGEAGVLGGCGLCPWPSGLSQDPDFEHLRRILLGLCDPGRSLSSPVSLPSYDSLSVPKGYPPVYSDYRLATVEGFWWRGAGGPSANPWLMNPRNLQTGNSPFFGVW